MFQKQIWTSDCGGDAEILNQNSLHNIWQNAQLRNGYQCQHQLLVSEGTAIIRFQHRCPSEMPGSHSPEITLKARFAATVTSCNSTEIKGIVPVGSSYWEQQHFVLFHIWTVFLVFLVLRENQSQYTFKMSKFKTLQTLLGK